jgi:hypothetical protein
MRTASSFAALRCLGISRLRGTGGAAGGNSPIGRTLPPPRTLEQSQPPATLGRQDPPAGCRACLADVLRLLTNRPHGRKIAPGENKTAPRLMSVAIFSGPHERAAIALRTVCTLLMWSILPLALYIRPRCTTADHRRHCRTTGTATRTEASSMSHHSWASHTWYRQHFLHYWADLQIHLRMYHT